MWNQIVLYINIESNKIYLFFTLNSRYPNYPQLNHFLVMFAIFLFLQHLKKFTLYLKNVSYFFVILNTSMKILKYFLKKLSQNFFFKKIFTGWSDSCPGSWASRPLLGFPQRERRVVSGPARLHRQRQITPGTPKLEHGLLARAICNP